MRRCRWCGRFVAKDCEPIWGVNAYGEGLWQLLCPDCGPHWVSLSAANQSRPYMLR